MDKLKALLIEDSASDAFLVQLHLQEYGIEVDTVATVREGATRIVESDYDVVILDLRLPDAEGMEAFRAIAACEGHPTIVVHTGMPETEEMVAAFEREGDFAVKGSKTEWARIAARASQGRDRKIQREAQRAELERCRVRTEQAAQDLEAARELLVKARNRLTEC